MKKFEYQQITVNCTEYDLVSELNYWGSDGWQTVSIEYSVGGRYKEAVTVLMREVEGD